MTTPRKAAKKAAAPAAAKKTTSVVEAALEVAKATNTDVVAEVTLVFERDTKNTYRYEEVTEDGDSPILRTVYLPKSLLGKKPPATITVTVKANSN